MTEVVDKKVKLIVRVISPPVILFRLDGSGVHSRVDITNQAESAWHDAEHYAFMVEYPGRYQVAQRGRVDDYTIDKKGMIVRGGKNDKKHERSASAL